MRRFRYSIAEQTRQKVNLFAFYSTYGKAITPANWTYLSPWPMRHRKPGMFNIIAIGSFREDVG